MPEFDDEVTPVVTATDLAVFRQAMKEQGLKIAALEDRQDKLVEAVLKLERRVRLLDKTKF